MNEQDLKQSVGAAIMLAKPGCCQICDVLVNLRDQLYGGLLQLPNLPAVPAAAAVPPPPNRSQRRGGRRA